MAKTIAMTPAAQRGAVWGSLYAYMQPRLAEDSKFDYGKIPFDKLDGKNFKTTRPAIEAAVRELSKDQLAKDADINDLAQLLDALADESEVPSPAEEPNSAIPPGLRTNDAEPDDTIAKVKALLAKNNVDPSIIAQLDALLAEGGNGNGNGGPGGMDETEEERKKREDEEAAKKAAGDKNAGDNKDGKDAKDGVTPVQKDLVTKSAMDEAIKTAVQATQDTLIKSQREIREALRYVRPWVGEVPAMDEATSADAVYRTALKVLGVKDYDKLHSDALKPILDVQSKPGARQGQGNGGMAHDAALPAGTPSFAERFPGTKNVTHAG